MQLYVAHVICFQSPENIEPSQIRNPTTHWKKLSTYVERHFGNINNLHCMKMAEHFLDINAVKIKSISRSLSDARALTIENNSCIIGEIAGTIVLLA